jgi:hypothetical protein
VEDDQVADLLALGDVGPSGQDHERLGGLSGLRPRGRRQTEHESGGRLPVRVSQQPAARTYG